VSFSPLWVPDQVGGYCGEMAVLVKPRGLLGAAYMAAIRPFRHVNVYPVLIRQVEHAWRQAGDPAGNSDNQDV